MTTHGDLVTHGSRAAPTSSGDRLGDRVFRALTLSAGLFMVTIMGAIAAFLVWRAVPALSNNSGNFFTTTSWFPDQTPALFGIAALLFGTLMTAGLALLLAVPVGVAVALYVSHYATPRIGKSLGFVVDLLAAVPSIIFGLWGLAVLMPNTGGLFKWLNDYLGFIPIFQNTTGIYTKSMLLAGVVLAIMILPTVSSVSREVLVQAPRMDVEAALAVGATKWETMRMVVLPFGRPGIISAAILGLGRALGETIAVAIILSALFEINWHITEPGGNTFAANIALKWNEAGSNGIPALVASGLVLFLITLAVNMIARLIVLRRRTKEGTR